MKKLNQLKINEISKKNLTKKEMRHVVGGQDWRCSCSCQWEGTEGGSSVMDNCRANQIAHTSSTGGEEQCYGYGYYIKLPF